MVRVRVRVATRVATSSGALRGPRLVAEAMDGIEP